MNESTPHGNLSSDRLQPQPAWEEMPPQTGPELIGLIADEVWRRTREPVAAAQMGEAILAAVRDGRAWWPITEVNDLAYAQGMERAEQAAVIGYHVAGIIRAHRGITTPEEICVEAMREAGIVPLSSEVRAECEARSAAARNECHRLEAERPTQTTDAESP